MAGVDGVGISISTTTCSLGDTSEMLPRGNSLSVSLLMMVLSLLELDQVQRELCRCTRQPATDFGLTMSIPKTRHLVAGREAADSDATPIQVSGGEITSVNEFLYLGSVVATSVGWMWMWRRE